MDVIERAKSKREALLKEARRLDDFIKMAESLDAELQPVVGNAGVAAAPIGSNELKTLSNKARVEAAVFDLIKTHGPMKKQDIYQHLQKLGIDPGSKNPPAMLSILLSRSNLFINNREKGVWQIVKGKGPTGVNQ